MNVLLVSVGTDGDIIPYVGLGRTLRDRGHQVTLIASTHYESLAKRYGLAFQALISAEEHDALFEHPDFWNPLKTAPLAARWGVRFIRRQYALLSTLVTPDTVIIANPAVFAASLLHETRGIPYANLMLQPGLIPSSISPPIMPGVSFLARAPQPVWKVFWRGLDAMGDLLVGRELNRVRAELGLKPQRRIFTNWLSRQLVIGMFPEWYGQPQADWPAQIQLVGFPEFDGGFDDALPREVLDFCQAGTPPVAITFGTGMAHSAALFQTALEACHMLGERGILLTKYRNELPNSLPATLLHCPFAPFQKLFPHCVAVVHHGGIGTTAKAMAAGLPQLVQPICFDQRDNGMRMKRLGAGDCLTTRRVSAKQLATALTALMTNEARENCRKVMSRFDKRDAFLTAAELLEGTLGTKGRTIPSR